MDNDCISIKNTKSIIFGVDSDERIDEADSELNDDSDPGVVAAVAMGNIWLKHPVWCTISQTSQPTN